MILPSRRRSAAFSSAAKPRREYFVMLKTCGSKGLFQHYGINRPPPARSHASHGRELRQQRNNAGFDSVVNRWRGHGLRYLLRLTAHPIGRPR